MKIDVVPKPEPQDSSRTKNRVVIVSNRLPIVVAKREGGGWRIKPGQGGLVTALAPILRDRGGLWIGWPGTSEEVDFDRGDRPILLRLLKRDPVAALPRSAVTV
jgi:trehalose-6-phosphate synthase